MSIPSTPAERTSRLAALRAQKTIETAHAFVRASAPLFYEVLSGVKVPAGPAVWISGDCHAENVGAVPDAKGRVELAMNDFDETVIGNPAHDVTRMALSLAIAMRGAGHAGSATVAMLTSLLEGYCAGLESKRDVDPEADRLRATLEHATKIERRDLLERLCDDAHPRTIPHGEKFWPLSDAMHAELAKVVASKDVQATVRLSGDVGDGSIELLDAAFRVAGTASLGAFRAALLVEIDGDSCPKRDRVRILDVKEVQPTSTPRAKATPKNDAERVLAGTKALVPDYAARRCAVTVHGKSTLLRELMPQEAKANVDDLGRDEIEPVARSLGRVIGRAHGRQLDARDAAAWRKEIAARDWLVAALAALVGAHEAAYVRRCALGADR